ncbi:MAG TPA: excinuclease ABC subunit UvrC [Solirubrobacteraceae bacterium]|jgi:excinuclease ABC subunit C|nr:excinuclease ABC subunit UvrC [Solirubrobacteraceae bacterium]
MSEHPLFGQRRGLPDQPGVYLFRDGKGRVVYVGKAKSIRKRVASHFAKAQVPSSPGHAEMVAAVEQIEFIVVGSEAEALLAEQSFIKQYRPRFNIRLRDDKSYPFIAISLDEEFPRVYFTRERHRPGRAYFGPYSNAKRVRGTLDLLTKIFMFRSCTGPEPGRRSGSPCLDYYIKRCEAPCVGYVSKADYRRSIDGVVDFLSGRYRTIERDLRARMQAASEAQEYEQATLERNRLRAVRSLLERQRVASESIGTLDAVAVALDGTEANAQVFQVRDGVLSDRQSFYLANEAERALPEVAEEFMLQYYAGHSSIPAQIVVQRELVQREPAGGEAQAGRGGGGAVRGSGNGAAGLDALAEALASRRGGPVELRAAERGDKRRILELAERNARLALDQEHLRAERRRQSRVEALEGLQRALGLDVPPVRIECFDISNLGGTHTVAAMVVLEGGAPKKSDYRRFKIRTLEDGVPDDYAAMAEVLSRRFAQWERQADLSPHDPEYDASFATLPNVVVIDGGRGQLAAGIEPLRGFRERGVAVISLAKRIEEVFIPGRRTPLVLDHATPELQLLQRARDEAHRFAITHHRSRRDRALTSSLLDELPGVGPARKRALLAHFGSPEAVVGATREELQAVPGLPAKIARELHAHLNRTG